MTSPRTPQMILHVGAPKCGSSALQTALSATPDLRDAQGVRYCYTSVHNSAGTWHVEEGRQVTRHARLSPYGYASWADFGPAGVSASDILDVIEQTLIKGKKWGHVPILSNESWISHPSQFADALARWGNPPVDVVVFLRPVVDWINAAFWQWGVWHTANLDTWMARSNMPYRFADDIAAWAQIPNVRLIVRSQRPDVVAKFADIYGLDINAECQTNTASSAILIGVLLRNRSFRSTGHDGSIEFVVQRWCPPIPGRKLWSVLSRHVRALRPVCDATLETLCSVLPAQDVEDLLVDPRWMREAPYHADILEGVTQLNDPALFSPLFHALCSGVEVASQAVGIVAPDLPECPPEGSDIATWDAAICHVLKALIETDKKVRQATLPRWQQVGFDMLTRLSKR